MQCDLVKFRGTLEIIQSFPYGVLPGRVWLKLLGLQDGKARGAVGMMAYYDPLTDAVVIESPQVHEQGD